MNAHTQVIDLTKLAQAWSELQRIAPVQPIRTSQEFERIQALADVLSTTVGQDDEHPLSSLFELTMTLIKEWEDKHVSLESVPPREILRYLLEEHDLKEKDLADIASPSVISDILAGRRKISEPLAKSLAERFHIDIAAFI